MCYNSLKIKIHGKQSALAAMWSCEADCSSRLSVLRRNILSFVCLWYLQRFIPVCVSQSCVSAFPPSISSELHMSSVDLSLHWADNLHIHTCLLFWSTDLKTKKRKLAETELCRKLRISAVLCFSLFCDLWGPRGDKCNNFIICLKNTSNGWNLESKNIHMLNPNPRTILKTSELWTHKKRNCVVSVTF